MRLTPRLEQAIDQARAASARFCHPCVSSAHLVLGLLMADRGVAKVLNSVGLTCAAAEQYLGTHSPRTEPTQQEGEIMFGISAKLAIDCAEQERAEQERRSRPIRSRYVGTDHLLLALCGEESGDASDLFEAHNVDRARARQLVLEGLAKPWPPGLESLLEDTERLLNEIENPND